MAYRVKVALRGVGTGTFGKAGGDSYVSKAAAEKQAAKLKRTFPKAHITIVRG